MLNMLNLALNADKAHDERAALDEKKSSEVTTKLKR
jgi:hypothetical protein